MSWKKIEEMPCVLSAIRKAENKIKELTGIEVTLSVNSIEITDERKSILQDIICDYFQVSWKEVRCKKRTQRLVNARHIYMYLAHKQFEYIQEEVAADVNLQDHSSVWNAVKKIDGYYKVGDKLIDHVEAIKNLIPQDISNEKV
ncbi:MAG TPA: hypothetical protein DIT07_12790 [Sphingobacteriaceae bacterium]|nr:hypothetical protein [Sphingobacteriaceae bacterium]